MIKANELRIGNLLLLLAERREVININEKVVTVKSKSGYIRGVDIDLGGLSPIQISEKILKRSGFKAEKNKKCKFKLWHFPSLINCNNLFILLHNKPYFVASVKTAIYLNDNHLMECRYVHQLQNLYFALTGKELEIK